jgi:hypothetical protein
MYYYMYINIKVCRYDLCLVICMDHISVPSLIVNRSEFNLPSNPPSETRININESP